MSDKAPLVSNQPTYNGVPPAYGAPPTNQPPSYKSGGTGVLDADALAKLANVEDFTLKQGNLFGEQISCGICANTWLCSSSSSSSSSCSELPALLQLQVYVVGDRSNMVHVPGRPANEMVENPLFVVLEEAECWRRCWCCGKHPMLAKFYHAEPTCCYTGHKYFVDKSKPVVMTVERDGLCNRPGTLAALPGNRVIGRSVNPADGGCCKPTLNIMEVEPGHPEAHVADMVGQFSMNSVNAPGSSDLGDIVKRKPEGCWDTCVQCSTDIDNYEITMNNKKLNPLQKANFLATAVHLDYWFYQRDPRPIENHGNGRSGVIVITLCMMYIRGCSIPIQICIPYGQK
eukprot:gene874-3468_t